MKIKKMFSLVKKKAKPKMNKPLSAYKQLNESSRRLVNKLIINLTDENLDDKVKMSINLDL